MGCYIRREAKRIKVTDEYYVYFHKIYEEYYRWEKDPMNDTNMKDIEDTGKVSVALMKTPTYGIYMHEVIDSGYISPEQGNELYRKVKDVKSVKEIEKIISKAIAK